MKITKEPPGADIILINSQEQVLLVLRDNKPSIPFPNTWALLGGYIEAEESPNEAIHRELKEEIELTLESATFFKKYQWPECEEYIFWHQKDIDINRIRLNEGQKLAYFSRKKLDSLAFASHYGEILREFFEIAPFKPSIKNNGL